MNKISTILVLCLFLSGCYSSQKMVYENLGCDYNSGGPYQFGTYKKYEYQPFGVLMSKWISNNTLRIETFESGYCSQKKEIVSYRASGNHIYLKQKLISSEATLCHCKYILRYDISDIPYENYSINFVDDNGKVLPYQ